MEGAGWVAAVLVVEAAAVVAGAAVVVEVLAAVLLAAAVPGATGKRLEKNNDAHKQARFMAHTKAQYRVFF